MGGQHNSQTSKRPKGFSSQLQILNVNEGEYKRERVISYLIIMDR